MTKSATVYKVEYLQIQHAQIEEISMALTIFKCNTLDKVSKTPQCKLRSDGDLADRVSGNIS